MQKICHPYRLHYKSYFFKCLSTKNRIMKINAIKMESPPRASGTAPEKGGVLAVTPMINRIQPNNITPNVKKIKRRGVTICSTRREAASVPHVLFSFKYFIQTNTSTTLQTMKCSNQQPKANSVPCCGNSKPRRDFSHRCLFCFLLCGTVW